MRRSTTRPIRLAIALAAGGALALTACGDDDGGGSSTDGFCEEIAKVAEVDDEASDEENLAAIQAVADVTPSEIANEMNRLVDAFEQLQSFDAEAASEEEMGEFLAIAAGVEEASAKIEEFAIEKCPDLPADLFSTD